MFHYLKKIYHRTDFFFLLFHNHLTIPALGQSFSYWLSIVRDFTYHGSCRVDVQMPGAGRAFCCPTQPPEDAHTAQQLCSAMSPAPKGLPRHPPTAAASHPDRCSITRSPVGSADKWDLSGISLKQSAAWNRRETLPHGLVSWQGHGHKQGFLCHVCGTIIEPALDSFPCPQPSLCLVWRYGLSHENTD